MAVSRHDPPDFDEGSVFALYGSVMMSVQVWEAKLLHAAHGRWLQTKHQKNLDRAERLGHADPGQPGTDESNEALKRLEHLFLAGTTGAVRDQVKKFLGPDELAQYDELRELRNGLAHAFLRDQWDGDAGRFREGTRERLADCGRRFEEGHASLDARPGVSYTGPVPADWPAKAERIIDKLFRGEPLDDEDRAP